jgi:hypothetical protein
LCGARRIRSERGRPSDTAVSVCGVRQARARVRATIGGRAMGGREGLFEAARARFGAPPQFITCACV